MGNIFLRKTSQNEVGMKYRNIVQVLSTHNVLEQVCVCSVEELQIIVETTPELLLVLFELSFYEKLLGTENRLNKDIYFDTDGFIKCRDAVSALFKNRVVSKVCVNGDKELYQVTVRGVSRFGYVVLDGLKRIPHELQMFYCSDCHLDIESNLGLYELSLIPVEATFDVSRFFNELLDNVHFANIDVSCLSLQQLCRNNTIKYLIARYGKVYLNVDVYPGTDIRLKSLIWR